MWQYRGETGDLTLFGGAASFVLGGASRCGPVEGDLERRRGRVRRNSIRRPAVDPLRIQRGSKEEIGAFSGSQLREVSRRHEPAPRMPLGASAIVMLDQDVVARVREERRGVDIGLDEVRGIGGGRSVDGDRRPPSGLLREGEAMQAEVVV